MHQMLSVVMNIFVILFFILLLTSCFFVRRGYKNKRIESINSCLFAILNFSLFMIIQFSAVEIGRFGGGFLHIFGFVAFGVLVLGELVNSKLSNEGISFKG